jgi:hypothetical protein
MRVLDVLDVHDPVKSYLAATDSMDGASAAQLVAAKRVAYPHHGGAHLDFFFFFVETLGCLGAEAMRFLTPPRTCVGQDYRWLLFAPAVRLRSAPGPPCHPLPLERPDRAICFLSFYSRRRPGV